MTSTNATAATAEPEAGTIIQVATCATCARTIEHDGRGWYHAYTGRIACDI